MKIITAFFFLCIISLATTLSSASDKDKVVVQIIDAKGENIGTATLRPMGKEAMEIRLNVHGLTPGLHGIHIHDVGKCEIPDFKSAMAHWNPDGKQHGNQNPKGPHKGDMLNFLVKKDGTSKSKVLDAKISFAKEKATLTGGEGKSIVIHAAADDLKTDPSGNSGARIACGVIK